jgi:hypothetical protein
MCFMVNGTDMINNHTKRANPHVAKKDITVYKIIGKDGDGLYYNLKINRKVEPWTRGWWYYITGKKFNPVDGAQYVIGGNCFHSYESIYQLKQNLPVYPTQHIVSMIIPKGAQYYINEWGEYVSDQIIFPLKK